MPFSLLMTGSPTAEVPVAHGAGAGDSRDVYGIAEAGLCLCFRDKPKNRHFYAFALFLAHPLRRLGIVRKGGN